MANKQSRQALKRRAEKQHQRAVAKKAEARRSALHAARAGLDGVSPYGSTLPKLSEQIWAYAAPLRDRAVTAEDLKRAAQIAIMCWNAALLPAGKVEELLQPTIAGLANGDPGLEAELLAIFMMMQVRKHEHFGSDQRLVADYSLSDTPDGVHLLVTSAVA
jgi:hypothetical protein